MSKLQTRFIDDTYLEYYNTGNHDLAQIYLKSEADKVIAELERIDTEHTLQIAKMNGYISHLEEERRWRKFSEEKPQNGQKVLFRAKYKTNNVRTWIGEFRNVDFDVFYTSSPGWGCEFLPNEIFGWMPLPSAPKEAK